MITDHPRIDHEALRALVSSEWDVSIGQLDFMPVGGDSWSYRSRGLYVNVRDGLSQRDGLGEPRDVEPSYEAAVALCEKGGLEFLLAPTPTRNGRALARLGRFAVTVAPYVEGTVGLERFSREQLVQAVGWISRLHAATDVVSGVQLAREEFVVGYADDLRNALDRACEPRDRGSYSERLRDLLAPTKHDVLRALDGQIALGTRLRDRGYEAVVTHGEPNSGNVLEAASGERWLVDLSFIMLGPPERDLFHLRADASPGDSALVGSLAEDVARFYEGQHDLGEVTEYTNRLASPHTGDPEDSRAWVLLLEYLPRAIR